MFLVVGIYNKAKNFEQCSAFWIHGLRFRHGVWMFSPFGLLSAPHRCAVPPTIIQCAIFRSTPLYALVTKLVENCLCNHLLVPNSLTTPKLTVFVRMAKNTQKKSSVRPVLIIVWPQIRPTDKGGESEWSGPIRPELVLTAWIVWDWLPIQETVYARHVVELVEDAVPGTAGN